MKNISDLKVLLVDDTELSVQLMTTAMKLLNISEIQSASDGRQAFSLIQNEAAQKRPFDLVISDYNMPVMNGLELLKSCREKFSAESLKFIMLTVESEKDIILHAVTLEANGYLLKPFNPEDLKTKVSEILLKLRNNI